MIFPLIEFAPSKIEELKEGTSNRTYLLDGAYVYRHKLTSDYPFFNATNEHRILNLLKGHNLAPKQLVYDEKTGDKVESYIDGAHLFSGNDEELVLLAESLRKLHFLPGETISPFNVAARYSYYKNKSLEDLGDESLLSDTLPLLGGEQVLCHNDLWMGNILIKNKEAYLIDFEFAGTNSPLFDLASLLSENQIDDERAIHLFLSSYYQKEDVEKETEAIRKIMHFENALWYYWAKCRYMDTKNKAFLQIMEDKKRAYLKK